MKRKISLLIALCLILSAFASFALADTVTGYIKTPASDGSVNIRSQGSAKYPIIGWVKNGAQVEILYQGNYWHKVRVLSSGKVGWVYAQYVQITSYSPDPAPYVPTDGTMATVTTKYAGSVVNLRTGPGTEYAVVSGARSGASLTVLASQGNWYQVYVPSRGVTAWISRNYVSLGLNAYATGDVNLRTGPGTEYARISVIKKGVPLNVLSQGSNWSQVYCNGQTGYISNKYWAYR